MRLAKPIDTQENWLLAALPDKERQILLPSLELVHLRTREEITAVGSRIRHMYFPVHSAISLMDLQPSGRSVEVSVIGKDGCTGVTVVQGYQVAPCRLIVQVGGPAFRLDTSVVLSSLAALPVLHRALTRLSVLMFREAVISVGCSQFHSVKQRLGRWLLAHEQRTGLMTFPFTHDFLAEQLGVQRVTVSETLGALRESRLIRYGYRKLQLLDLDGIEKITCECFGTAKLAIEEYFRDIKTYRTSS